MLSQHWTELLKIGILQFRLVSSKDKITWEWMEKETGAIISWWLSVDCEQKDMILWIG